MSACRHELSPRVAVILVWVPSLTRPWPLLPEEDTDYRACLKCDALAALVAKAQAGCPAVAHLGDFTRAVVVFDDGEGADIYVRRAEALA